VFALSPLPRNLAAALRDTHATKAEVRRSALRDLVRHADSADRSTVVSRMAAVLRDDADPEVRGAAAVALADAGAAEAVDDLLAAIGDAHLRVRQLALVALGEVGAPDHAGVRGALEQAFVDEAAALRYQALIGLVRIVAPEVDPILVTATRDSDADVRYLAIRLIEEHRIVAGQDQAPVELTVPIAARLRALLRDDSPAVRLAAAIALGHAGDAAGAACIVAAVDAPFGRFDLEDEQAAVELAGVLRLESARRGLHRRAFGWFGLSLDPTSYPARIALARCGDERATGAILRGLTARTRDARTMAVVAAGRARLAAAREPIRAMRGDPGRAEPSAVAEALALLDATGE
jgi:HEAT repeat protein